jgi:hypothetical protein
MATEEEVNDGPEVFVIEKNASLEIARVKAARRIFDAEVRVYPEAPQLIGFWSSVGLSGWLTTLSFIGVSLISAITVAVELFIQSSTYSSVMAARIPVDAPGRLILNVVVTYAPLVMFICAPAFELAIANYGFTEARKQNKLEYTWVEMVPPMSVVVLTGLSRALISTPPTAWFYPAVDAIRLFMELATAVAAPITGYTASRIFATLYNVWEHANNLIIETWKSEKLEIDGEFAHYYKTQGHKLSIGADRRDKTFSPKKQEEDRVNMNVAKLVREYLASQNLSADRIGEKPTDLMTPEQVSSSIGVMDTAGRQAVRKALSRMRLGPTNGRDEEAPPQLLT